MSDPNLTTFQGRMCTRVKRQVTNTQAPAGNTTSTSTSTTSTSTSTSTSTTQTQPAPNQNTNTQQPQQQPQTANTNTTTPTSTPTTTATQNANPPNRTPQATANPVAASSPTTTSTPTSQPTTTTDTGTTVAAAQPAQSQNDTSSQNTEPAQVSNGTPNTQNTVPTAPAAGGQRPPQTDSGTDPSSPQGGNMNTRTAVTTAAPVIASGAPKASPLAGGAQPPLAEPDTSPLLAQPILLSSGQAGLTVLSTGRESAHEPSTSTTILVSTGTDGLATSITSAFVVTPSASHDGGDDHSAGAGHSADGHVDDKHVAPAAVVGTVFGVVAFLAFAGMIFFCVRRRRGGSKRNSGTPLIANRDGASSNYSTASAKFAAVFSKRPSGETFSNAKMAMSEKMGAVFAKRPSGAKFSNAKAAMTEKFGAVLAKAKGSSGVKETSVPRMPTPNLERGVRDAPSSFYSKPVRTRSSSVPVMALKDRALGFFKGGKGVSRPRFGRKHDSDTSFVGVATSQAPPRLPSPTAQHRRSAASVSSFLQSWSATDDNNNPFRDPDPSQPLKVKNPDLSRSNTMKTTTELPPILMPKSFSPQLGSPNANYGASARSPGIVAAAAAPVPILNPPQKPRHKRSFSQSRIENPFLDQEPSAALASPTSLYTTADGILRADSWDYRRHTRNYTVASMGRPLEHQPSKSSVDSGFVSAKSPLIEQEELEDGAKADADPMKQWRLSTVQSSRMEGNSVRSSRSSDESPFSDEARISQFSFLNDSPVLSSSPGPTRPVTSAYPSYLLDRQSRLSDPFDLDRPEIWGLMKPHWTNTMASRDTSMTRSGSNRSSKSRQSRAAVTTPTQRKNSNAAGYLLPTDVYRPV